MDVCVGLPECDHPSQRSLIIVGFALMAVRAADSISRSRAVNKRDKKYEHLSL